MKLYEFIGPPPEPDIEYRLAHKLLGARSDLDRRVLGALVGHPQRFSELKHLLDGRKDANLTQALARLQRDGLLRTRMDARTKPVIKTYELTQLGALVVFRIAQMSPVHESIEAYRRGQAASST